MKRVILLTVLIACVSFRHRRIARKRINPTMRRSN